MNNIVHEECKHCGQLYLVLAVWKDVAPSGDTFERPARRDVQTCLPCATRGHRLAYRGPCPVCGEGADG